MREANRMASLFTGSAPSLERGHLVPPRNETARSDGRGLLDALEEGEVADVGRLEHQAVLQVLAYPLRRHGRGLLGLLARLPQADRQAGLVVHLGDAVADESVLLLELREHAFPRLVGDLGEGATGDLVGRDPNVLHACLPLGALVPGPARRRWTRS